MGNRTLRLAALAAAFAGAIDVSQVHGQTPTTAPAQPPAAESAELPGPRFNNLRFKDDFSYLDGEEESYRPDFFDPIKNIGVGEDWRVSFGGDVRLRIMSETNNRNFGAIEPAQDTFLLHRVFLHADVKYRNLFRVFVQGVNAMVEDRDFAALGIDENRFDFQQVFADMRILGEDVPLTLRVGRQDLLYGNERLVSPLDWSSTRRRFDGVKLFWRGEMFDVDAWYVRTLPINRRKNLHRKPDEYNPEHDFYGLYTTYKGIKDHGIDAYFLSQRRTDNPVNANGRAGDLSLYNLGMRFWGHTGPWDYETEWGGQWGKFAGQTIQAWMFTGEGGYTFKTVPWTPRLGLGVDYASGDDDPTDNVHQTYNQFFPLGHAHLGYLDLVARQNIFDARVELTVKPTKKLTTRAAYHAFWLDESADALYNSAGVPVRRLLSGNASNELGHELDLTATYQFDAHSSVLLGWSHFWGGNFITSTGPSEDADLLYLQYVYKF